LSVTYEGTTYVTESLPLGATAIEIDAALATAFHDLTGATVYVTDWSERSYTVVFDGTLAGHDLADLEVAFTPVVLVPELTQTQVGATVVTPAVPEHDVVVDYAARPLTVPTGGVPVVLTMDGDDGELTEVTGNIEVQVADFLTVSGDISIRSASAEVYVLGEIDPVDVRMLTVGGKHLTGFAGLNGGTDEAIGLTFSDLEFAFAMARQSIIGADDRQWIATIAKAGDAGFVGGDVLNITGEDLTAEVTRPAGDGTFLDLKNHPLEVRTGRDDADKLTLDLDSSAGPVTRFEGTLNLQVGNFFQSLGTYHIDKTQGQLVPADGGGPPPIDVDLLLVGGSNASAFIGLNGGTADAVGLIATGVNFGLLLATSQDDPT
ncbi:MAG TPA: hypothetical protein PLV92_28170, partial [Pirellulaceae bacterium]|nr:hypothetical protein [Pirellulaceae bacterium]